MPFAGEMKGYGAETYGERIADIYDELYEEMLDTESTVEFLAKLAGKGPVLELAVGTGRVALPLTERDIEVHGIDSSEAMVERLRAKPGGDRIRVTMGDFAEVGVEGRYPLIFVVFNTLFALTSQEDQVRCFQNVAEHLEDGGCFVIEVFVPDIARFDRGQRVSADRVEVDRVVLETSLHDPVGQRVTSQHVVIGDRETRLVPVHIRYAWPSELDLMARLAGLRLKERWAGWQGEYFTAESVRHVSVYEKP
jgi:SAM-dependent methyltransferase